MKLILEETGMIELYELRQFAAFADAGTLSAAAEILHLSQPALSRNMKKLEDELGIALFERKKNKMGLNRNGEYALELAKKLLDDSDSFVSKVRDFDRKNRTITLGVCAPAPVWRLAPLISNLFPHMTLQTEMDDDRRLLTDLENNIYQLVSTHTEPDSAKYFYKECGKESLMFALPKNHKYARRKSLSFAEMNGENMLLMPDIGFWDFVRTDKMPDSRFLTQNDRFSFQELVLASSLPSFTSDLAEKYSDVSHNRVCIPISDDKATVTYYLRCKPANKKSFLSLFSAL